MPEFNLKESIITSLNGKPLVLEFYNAQEPWPDNVKLFQPYEVEQILLPDNASCLAVQSFLKMCNLPFEVEMRWNAEFMSPSGRVPFIKCGAFVVSELEPIVQFAANKGVSLCSRMSSEEKAEMRAYMSLITNVLVNAELYISWLDDDTFNNVTKVRNSSVYPWPLGWIQTRSKRNAVAKRLKALNWHDKTLDQVLADVEQCCNSLSQRLGDKDFFFGTWTPLDALACGHVRALLGAQGSKTPLLIKCITNTLLKLAVRVAQLTEMTLTPQEEYLITQAFQAIPPPVSDRRNARRRPAVVCSDRTSGDNVELDSKGAFGFKPFASKQVIIMSTKPDESNSNEDVIIDRVIFIHDIVQEIVQKVEENTMGIEGFTEKTDERSGDFLLIDTIEKRVNDYLDTIDEMTDSTSIETCTDIMQMINDDDLDSDGVVNDKLLNTLEENKSEQFELCQVSDETESSAVKETSKPFLNLLAKSSSTLSTKSNASGFSSESKSTLKFPSNEDISLTTLLKYMKKKHPEFELNSLEIAELD